MEFDSNFLFLPFTKNKNWGLLPLYNQLSCKYIYIYSKPLTKAMNVRKFEKDHTFEKEASATGNSLT